MAWGDGESPYRVTVKAGAAPSPVTITAAGLQELMMTLGRGAAFMPPVQMPTRSRAEIFRAAKPPTNIIGHNGGPTLAMDEATTLAQDWDNTVGSYAQAVGGDLLTQGIGFLGYPFLAELAQRPEYRKISETIAEELTRKWIRVTYKGDKDKTERVNQLNDSLKRFKLRERFQGAALTDGLMGRAQLYADMGDDGDELTKPLMLTKEKVGRGKLKGFRLIEPMWSYPLDYNSSDPLREDFYVPTSWAVMQRRVHASRLLTFVGRPMPDLLKPAYAFGGLSLSQMAIPYVQNWLRTRQSVSDLVHSFSIMILMTDLGGELNAGGMAELIKRVQTAVAFRDNRGMQVVDKNREDFKNVAAPISGLHELQAQSLEQICVVSGIPLVKYTGITPAGLNANSDGEIRVFYDKVTATQEKFMGPHLDHALSLIQLSEWGEVDPDIVYEWVPLWQLDEAGQAAVRKTDADTGAVLIEAGVLDPAEERKRVASTPNSPYAGLDIDDLPEPPADDFEDGEGGDIPGATPRASGNPAKSAEPASVERAGDAAFERAGDAAFVESDHPRDDDGKFTAGGGGGAPPAATPAAHPEVAKTLGAAGLKRLHDAIASKDHKAILAALAPAAGARREGSSMPMEHHGSPQAIAAFLGTRTYHAPDGSEASHPEIVGHLVDKAMSYAGAGGVRRDREVLFVTGPPAAGKSTIAEILAERSGAAILDPDDAKKVIPEFNGGLDASYVHEESSTLTADVGEELTNMGANIIYPMVGDDAAKISKKIDAYRARGYKVGIVNLDVSADNAAQRMAKRYAKTGRLIDPGYFGGIVSKEAPQKAYAALRDDGRLALGAAQVEGNAAPGEESIKDVIGSPAGFRHGQLAKGFRRP